MATIPHPTKVLFVVIFNGRFPDLKHPTNFYAFPLKNTTVALSKNCSSYSSGAVMDLHHFPYYPVGAVKLKLISKSKTRR
jgi:hypothetical protein